MIPCKFMCTRWVRSRPVRPIRILASSRKLLLPYCFARFEELQTITNKRDHRHIARSRAFFKVQVSTVEKVPRYKGFRGHQSKLGDQPDGVTWKATRPEKINGFPKGIR